MEFEISVKTLEDETETIVCSSRKELLELMGLLDFQQISTLSICCFKESLEII